MCNGPLYVDSFSAFQLLRNYNRINVPPDMNRYHNLAFMKEYEHMNPIVQPQPLPPRSLKLNLDPNQLHDPRRITSRSSSPNVTAVSSTCSPASRADLPSIDHFQCILSRRQRGEKRPIPEEQKDEKYFERRKRNNEAAKKSRDARKLREDRIALRAALLEQENAILKAQIFALREELLALQQMICNRANI